MTARILKVSAALLGFSIIFFMTLDALAFLFIALCGMLHEAGERLRPLEERYTPWYYYAVSTLMPVSFIVMTVNEARGATPLMIGAVIAHLGLMALYLQSAWRLFKHDVLKQQPEA